MGHNVNQQTASFRISRVCLVCTCMITGLHFRAWELIVQQTYDCWGNKPSNGSSVNHKQFHLFVEMSLRPLQGTHMYQRRYVFMCVLRVGLHWMTHNQSCIKFRGLGTPLTTLILVGLHSLLGRLETVCQVNAPYYRILYIIIAGFVLISHSTLVGSPPDQIPVCVLESGYPFSRSTPLGMASSIHTFFHVLVQLQVGAYT